jgi:hypothetical protein
MTTGDFDHDGIADVVTVGQSVSVLLGDGAGGFRAPVISPGGGQPFIVTGDFDADGTLDLAFSEGPGIVGQNDPSQVVVMLGNGDGSFQAPVQYPVDDGAWSLSAGDFDGDGKADLAALATGSNVVIVLVGNGDGTFRPAVRSAATSAMIGMVAADFDLDHKLDVAALVRYNNANAVALIRGRGDGRFGAVVDSPGPGVNESVAGMITADVDGDDKIDLIGTQPGEDGLLIWLGRGDGSFRAPRQVPAGRQPMSIAQADLNGDGKIDLVTTNVVGHDICVLLGTGDGTFQDPVHHPVAGDITAIVVSDVNGDGRPDLMLSVSDNGANERLALMLNTGSDFADPVPICAGVSAPLVVADLDGDGDVDLIVAKPQDGVLRVLLGNGDGTFTANLTVLSSWSPLAGDFDQDGKLDLAFCGGVVAFGNGDGTFRTVGRTTSTSLGGGAGDFNGDGKLDLLCEDEGFTLLLGRGDGTFQPPVNYMAPYGPGLVVLGDFNNDGMLDTALVNTTSDTVTVMLNGTCRPMAE